MGNCYEKNSMCMFAFVLLLSLGACSQSKRDVTIDYGNSEQYTNQEMDRAIAVIKDKFLDLKIVCFIPCNMPEMKCATITSNIAILWIKMKILRNAWCFIRHFSHRQMAEARGKPIVRIHGIGILQRMEMETGFC